MPRPLSQLARRKAVDAAQELLRSHGIDGFTVDGVSRLSGVAKTTLYRHWRSVTELLVEAVTCEIDQVPVPDTGSLRGDLVEMLTTMGELLVDPADRRLMLDLVRAAALDPEFAELKARMMAEQTRPGCVVIERAIGRGEIPPVTPELATLLIQGPMLARFILHPEPLGPDEVHQLVDHIVRGLGVQPPSASSEPSG